MNYRFVLLVGMIISFASMYETRAKAELVLQFGQGTSLGLTDFTKNPGELLILDIYVTQTGAESRLNTPGIGAAAFEYEITGGPEVIHADPNTAITSPNFSNSPIVQLSNSQLLQIQLTAPEDPNNGTLVVPVTTTGNSLFLATATIDVGAGASGDYTLTLRPDAAFGFAVGNNIFSNIVFPTAAVGTLHVTAVPEPSYSGFAMIVIAAGGWKLRRQSKKRIVIN